MKLRTIAAGISLAAAAFALPTAHAENVTLRHTIVVDLTPDGAGGYSAVFGQAYGAPGADTVSFIDTYLFTVPHEMESSMTYGALTSLYTKLSAGVGASTPSVKDLNITDFGRFSYYNGQIGYRYSNAHNNNNTYPYYSGVGHDDRWSFDWPWSQPPGTWAVVVKGDVVGNFGGSYAVDLAVMPVPEPGEWGMLAAGLGVLGVMARRRNARA